MKKKMLPTMMGVALAGGMSAAAADVSVFGHLDMSWVAFDVDGGEDDNNLACTTCSLGFKGSEDLGNGLKAIFKLDFQFDMVNRNPQKGEVANVTYQYVTPGSNVTTSYVDTDVVITESITDRDQWVGLAGGFGKVRVGTISTGYKSHGAMIDPLYRTSLQGRDRGLQSAFHRGAGEEGQGRATNTIRWDSANYNGVSLVAHYTLDSDETDGEDENPYGIGLSYSNGGALVFADYITNDGGHTSTERDGWKVGGKYDMGMFSVMGQYEDYTNPGADDETIWQVAGTASLLGITAYLGLGFGDDDATSNEYTAWTLAVMHSMSKRTMVYTGFNQVDCDLPGGMSACSSLGAGGGEDDLFSLGLKHKF